MNKILELKSKEVLNDPINIELIALLKKMESEISEKIAEEERAWAKKSIFEKMFSRSDVKRYVGSGDLHRKAGLPVKEFRQRMLDLKAVGSIEVTEVINWSDMYESVVDTAVSVKP